MPHSLLKVVPLSTLLTEGEEHSPWGTWEPSWHLLGRREASPHSHLSGYGSYPQRLYIICFGFLFFSLFEVLFHVQGSLECLDLSPEEG